eukprot:g16097.t1
MLESIGDPVSALFTLVDAAGLLLAAWVWYQVFMVALAMSPPSPSRRVAFQACVALFEDQASCSLLGAWSGTDSASAAREELDGRNRPGASGEAQLIQDHGETSRSRTGGPDRSAGPRPGYSFYKAHERQRSTSKWPSGALAGDRWRKRFNFCHTTWWPPVARVVNLDPAAENFAYDCYVDVRELISVDDAMEELDYGPNGGLIFAMEYLSENMSWGSSPLALQDASKFLSGALSALTAMVNLELPHINVLTKCDLLPPNADVERYTDGDTQAILADLRKSTHPRFRLLNEALGQLLEDYSLVSFVMLNREDEESAVQNCAVEMRRCEDSIELCLAHVNHCIQYGENLEPEGNFDLPDDAMGFEGFEGLTEGLDGCDIQHVFGSNDPATYAGEMGLVEDEPVHLRIRSAHPGQRDTDCIDLTVMPFNTWQMIKKQMREPLRVDFEHRSGLRAIPDHNIRLLHKGIELRNRHCVETYIKNSTAFSPAEIQFVLLDQGDRMDSEAKDIGMYRDEQVPTRSSLLELVNEISDAMRTGIKPKLTEDGTGATYMLRGASSGKTLAVFKPKDEEAFAPNNPRGYVAEECDPRIRRACGRVFVPRSRPLERWLPICWTTNNSQGFLQLRWYMRSIHRS